VPIYLTSLRCTTELLFAACYDLPVTHSGTFLACCHAEAAFDLLSTPDRFAPLLPDYESMEQQDATHFTMRTVLAIGQIHGHINLTMELREASRPYRVGYRGQGIIAGGTLSFELDFRIAPVNRKTEIQWCGEVRLNGPLVFMAGDLVDTMSRQNFERMAESLRRSLEALSPSASAEGPTLPDFEI